MNKNVILDLCGGTGAWSKPYKDAGCDVCIITLPEYDVTDVVFNGSHRERDFASGMETVRACLEIIWKCQERGKLQFWALENPRGYLRRFLGVPKYTFEQWQFGGRYVKATDIWGYFKIPKPTVKIRPSGMTARMPNGRTNSRFWEARESPEEYEAYLSQLNSDDKRAAIRAITLPGFAQAFYKANKMEITIC